MESLLLFCDIGIYEQVVKKTKKKHKNISKIKQGQSLYHVNS